MRKFSLRLKKLLICASVLLVSLIPLQVAQSQSNAKDFAVARCILLFDVLSGTTAEPMKNFANTYVSTAIPDFKYHVQESIAFLGGQNSNMVSGMTEMFATFISDGIVWMEVLDCTRTLLKEGFMRPSSG